MKKRQFFKTLISMVLSLSMVFGTMPVMPFGVPAMAATVDSITGGGNGTGGSTLTGALNGIAYGSGMYLAVGNRGSVTKSTDGERWSVSYYEDGEEHYRGIAFGAGLFAVITANGRILTSDDGVSWTVRYSGSTYLTDITYVNGIFLAVGNNGTALSSTDGLTWNIVNLGASASGYLLMSISYGNGAFVVGARTTAGGGFYVFRSETGASGSWTLTVADMFSGGINGVYFLKDAFYAFTINTTVYKSSNGTSWSPFYAPRLTMPTQIFHALYDGSKFFMFGGTAEYGHGSVITSTDGAAWTLQPKTAHMTVQRVAYLNGKYFQLGNEGMIVSDDGINWHTVAGNYFDAAYDGTNYVTVGGTASGAEIYTSPNFMNRTSARPPFYAAALNGVVCGGGKFVAVGSSGLTAVSTDGTTWSYNTAGGTSTTFRGVAYGAGKYVAVGYLGAIYTSADGIGWTAKSSGVNVNLNHVSYIDNKFVAVGGGVTTTSKAVVLYSADGEVWTDSSPDIYAHFHDVAYGNGKYVLVGRDNVSGSQKFCSVTTTDITSTAGYSDMLIASEAIGMANFGSVAFGNGVFVSVTNLKNSPYDAYVLTSEDGANWTLHDANTTGRLRSVLFDGNSFRIVGMQDTKLTVTAGSSAPVTITDAQITGMSAPVTGETPASLGSLTAVGSAFTVTGLVWQNGDGSAATLTGDGKFLPGQVYRAQLTLTAAAGYQFPASGLTPQIDAGTASAGVVSGGGLTFAVTFAATHVPLPSLNVTGVRMGAMDTSQSPVIAEIEVEMADLGLGAGDFAVLNETDAGSDAIVTGVSYTAGKYILAVSGMNFYHQYRLRIEKAGYETYTNNSFFGSIAANADLNLADEPNLFDTYTKKLTAGKLKVENGVYSKDALIYPDSDPASLYQKLETNNGDNSAAAAAGDWRAAGAFVIAPAGTKGVKLLSSSKTMVQVGDDSLIDANPNFKETVASGKAANDNDYWKTIAFAPIYAKIAVKQENGVWKLNDPDDRYWIAEFYDNEPCAGSPVKTVRFAVEVSYEGNIVIVPPAPTGPVHNDRANTFGWTQVPGYNDAGEYEYSADSGASWLPVTSNPQGLPDGDFAAGAVRVRVKADPATGRAAGASLLSTAAYTLNPPNSGISPTSASFNAYYPLRADVTVTLDLTGDAGLAGIQNGTVALQENTDYTMSGDTVTILKSYLAKQREGVSTLTFAFSEGDPVDLSVTVSDTTPGIVSANSSEELAVYIAHPNVNQINLDPHISYFYEGGTISKALTIKGKGAVITAGAGVFDSIVRSNILSNYDGNVLFKIEGPGSMLGLEDLTLTGSGRIRSVVNVKAGGSFQALGVTFTNFFNSLGESDEDKNNNTNNFGVHAEPDAISVNLTNCTFGETNAFRNTVAVRGGFVQIVGCSFIGTDYPQRLNYADGYEYAVYLYGGVADIIGNNISGYDSTRQEGYNSSGIAVVPYYATTALIAGNTISQNTIGVDLSAAWKAYFPPEATLTVNGYLVNTPESAFAAGEEVRNANEISLNTGKEVFVLMDQDDSAQSFGYWSNIIGSVTGAQTSATLHFRDSQAVEDLIAASVTRTVEMLPEGETVWQPAAIVGEFEADAQSVTVSLTPGTTYKLRLKLTEANAAQEPYEIVTGYSEAVKVRNAALPVLSVQPEDKIVEIDDAAELSVGASGSGSLSYQWYKNSVRENSGGTAIDGAQSASYPAPTDVLGTAYYYCVVTNTDTMASGNQAAFVTTEAAAVTVNPHDSSIAPATAAFDKRASLQEDVAVTAEFRKNTLVAIEAGGSNLVSGTDYTVSGDTVTIHKTYLAAQEEGSLDLTFRFSGGADQTLTVTIIDTTPIPVTVTGITAAGKIYDGNTAAVIDVTGAALNGVQIGHSVTLVTAGAAGQFENADAGTDKNVQITGLALSGTDAWRYVLEECVAKADIEKKTLTITADAKEKVYGDADPDLTYHTDGLIAADSLDLELTREPVNSVGQYDITVKRIVVSDNYTVVYNPAKWTITPRPVTIKADDKQKMNGEDDPGLTYQVISGNLVGSDAFTGELGREEGENTTAEAMEFDILQNTLTLGGNYDITFIKGTFTIVPSVKCELLGVTAPEGTQINGTVLSAVVSYAQDSVQVDAGISLFASWKLYADAACTQELTDKTMPLAVGDNTAYIKITAQDAVISQVYTLNIHRKNNDASLTGLVPSSGELSPVFDRETTEYSVILKGAVAQLSFVPTASDATYASIKVNGVPVTNASPSDAVSIAFGKNDPVRIEVTAEDGTRKTYSVTATRLHNDNSLSGLAISSGNLSPAFSSQRLSYTVYVDNGTQTISLTPSVSDTGRATVKVNGRELTDRKQSLPVSLKEGANLIKVSVTAEDGTKQVYTVTVNRDLSSGVRSGNNNLSELIPSVGALVPGFRTDIRSYTMSVGNAVSQLQFTPVAEGGRTAVVRVNGTIVASAALSQAIDLQEGQNTVTVAVQAQNQTTKTYTVIINRAAQSANANAHLSGLGISETAIDGTFHKDVTTYTAAVGMDIEKITVTAPAEDAKATVLINGIKTESGAGTEVPLRVGNNTVTVLVVAENGTVKEYTLLVTRYSNRLIGLGISAGELSPAFDRDELLYTATVERGVQSVSFTPLLERASATVTVNGTEVANNSASGAIALEEGENEIPVVVKAEDGTQKTYRVIVYRKTTQTEEGDLVAALIKSLIRLLGQNSPASDLIAAKSSIEEAVERYNALTANMQSSKVAASEKSALFALYGRLLGDLEYITKQTNRTYYVEASEGFITNLERKLAADDGEKLIVRLNVSKIASPTGTTNGKVFGDAFDLTISEIVTRLSDQTVLAVNDNVQPRDGKAVMIKIRVPDELRSYSGLDIVYIDSRGRISSQNAWIERQNGIMYLVFRASHFSKYAIVYQEPEKTVNDPSDNAGSGTVTVSRHEPYITGYLDDTFRPENDIARAEAAVILSRLSKGYNSRQGYPVSFADVERGSWYQNAVGYGSGSGLLAGYEDGTFRPDGKITRAEFATVVVRFLGISQAQTSSAFTDVSGHWAEGYILALYAKGLISGYEDGTFRPNASITRAEAVTLLNAALDRKPSKQKAEQNRNVLLMPFTDVSQDHWAYNDILEAAVSHLATTLH